MTTHPDLSQQIEDLVRQHVDALRATAAAAVARAFAAVAASPLSARASTSPPSRPTRPRKTTATRRASEELVALGERFFAVLCQHPGETMTTLAPQVGVAPRVLHVAVAPAVFTLGRIQVDDVVDLVCSDELATAAAMTFLPTAWSITLGPLAATALAGGARRIARRRQVRVSRILPKPLGQLGPPSVSALSPAPGAHRSATRAARCAPVRRPAQPRARRCGDADPPPT